jgi:MSHA biogenesis protein MshP
MKPSIHSFRSEQGLGAIAAIVILVILSSLAAAVTRMGWVEQTGFGQDLQGARASQAANAGIEWGMYQALKGAWTDCTTQQTQNIDFHSSMGFLVTVTCDSIDYKEGESSPGVAQNLRLFTINAVACTSTTACPDASQVASATYVERKRQAQITDR